MGKSPFEKFDHIGVIVKDLGKAIKYYETLGVGQFKEADLSGLTGKTMFGKPVDFQLRMAKAQVGQVSIELIQPVKNAPLFEDFLKRKGEGINHIAFVVENLDKETAILVKKGYKVVLTARLASGGGGAYLDTGEVGGMLVELVQW